MFPLIASQLPSKAIPKDGKGSYMRENGGFDRSNFEKYVIDPVLNMLAKCEHVVLHNYGKDKKGNWVYYNKIKKHGMVQGYELTYSINKRPSGIKKQTIIDVQENPTTLKIAQDIIEGKERQKKAVKKNSKPSAQYLDAIKQLEEMQYREIEERMNQGE